jgi:hypothetical protein
MIKIGDTRHFQNSSMDQRRARWQYPRSTFGRYGKKEKLMTVQGEQRPQEELAR